MIIKGEKKMQIRTGTDIIEIGRIRESIEKTDKKFCEKIYSQHEIEYCESKRNQKYQHYAARFAAKEAIFKAISERIENKFEIDWKEIEILNNDNGRPYADISKLLLNEIEDIDISLSHCKEYAVANVVVIFNN